MPVYPSICKSIKVAKPELPDSKRKPSVLRLLDHFIPAGMFPRHHRETLHQCRVLVGVSLASGLSLAHSTLRMFQFRDQLAHLDMLLWVSVFAAVLLLSMPWIFQRTGSFSLAANLYGLATTLAMVCLVAMTGGFDASPLLPQWPLFTFFVFIMAGWRSALFWGLVAMGLWLAGTSADTALAVNVLNPETLHFAYISSIVLAVVTLLGVLWFFEFHQRILLGRLQSERDKALYAAAHDPLTGLCNRAAFEQRLRQLLERRTAIPGVDGLMMIDLDGFKPLNDSLGHKAGDQLLSAIAGRLRRSVGDSDLVARFGGDEFAVLIADLDNREDIKPLAKKIHQTLTNTFSLSDGTQVAVGASIGVAFLPDDGADPETLLHNADQAMFRARRTLQPYSLCPIPGGEDDR